MSKQEKTDEFLRLIRIVDKEFNHVRMGYFISIELVGALVVFFIPYILLLFYVYSVPGFLSLGVTIALIIAFLALIVSTWGFLDRKMDKVVVDQKYWFIIRKYHEKTKFQRFIIWFEYTIGFEPTDQTFENNALLKGLLIIKD